MTIFLLTKANPGIEWLRRNKRECFSLLSLIFTLVDLES